MKSIFNKSHIHSNYPKIFHNIQNKIELIINYRIPSNIPFDIQTENENKYLITMKAGNIQRYTLAPMHTSKHQSK